MPREHAKWTMQIRKKSALEVLRKLNLSHSLSHFWVWPTDIKWDSSSYSQSFVTFLGRWRWEKCIRIVNFTFYKNWISLPSDHETLHVEENDQLQLQLIGSRVWVSRKLESRRKIIASAAFLCSFIEFAQLKLCCSTNNSHSRSDKEKCSVVAFCENFAALLL